MEKQTNSVGRRKEAVARTYISRGTGTITVNGKDYKDYFPVMYLQNQVELPFKTLGESGTGYDVLVNVQGGGPKGQAEAIKMGISRGMVEINPEFRPILKKEGLMTRDPRSVERKKFGKAGARRSFQFSKR
jgi:small subunit ribosomal protein S9